MSQQLIGYLETWVKMFMLSTLWAVAMYAAWLYFLAPPPLTLECTYGQSIVYDTGIRQRQVDFPTLRLEIIQ